MVTIKFYMGETKPTLAVEWKTQHMFVVDPYTLDVQYCEDELSPNDDFLYVTVITEQGKLKRFRISWLELFRDAKDNSYSIYTSFYYINGVNVNRRTFWWWSSEPIETCDEEVTDPNYFPESLTVGNAVEVLVDEHDSFFGYPLANWSLLDDSKKSPIPAELSTLNSIPAELPTLDLCPTTEKQGLLDGKAYVKLLQVNPGLYPSDLTPEYVITRSARVSTNGPLTKGPEADARLIEYLWRHQHTSPFEQMSFTFELHVPIFVRTHFLRHRTAKLNEESQRYTEVRPEFFDPLSFEVRGNTKANKQSSSTIEVTTEITETFAEANRLTQSMYQVYEKLLRSGVSREIARSYLPLGTYTTVIYQMDLHNLLHLFNVRCDSGAQRECRDIAFAMLELIRPICPVTIAAWEKSKRNVVLTEEEIVYLTTKKPFTSKTQESEFTRKCEQHPELFAFFNN